jgi:hypothetical protein
MRALSGCRLRPLTELRQQQLEEQDLTERDRLGAPFKIVDSDVNPLRLEVAIGADPDGGGCGPGSSGSFLRAVGSLGFGPKSWRLRRAIAWPRWLLRGSGRVW